MSTLRLQALGHVDRALSILLIALLAGGILAFGTQVWWGPPVFGTLTLALCALAILRGILLGRFVIRRSPLGLIGGAALLLGMVQLLPLPASLAGWLSPRSQALYSLGVVPEMVLNDDPTRDLPPTVDVVRSPATLDRPATLRWLLGALACLALFGVAAGAVDRLGLLYCVLGAIVAGFLVNGVVGFLQLIGGSGGLYGLFRPGQGPSWAPSAADLTAAPVATVLRPIGDGPTPWTAAVARPVELLGSLLGGPGAFVALASLGLPLAFGVALHLLAPRGSREPLAARLRDSGRSWLVGVLSGTVLLGGGMVGYLAGPGLTPPFVLGLLLVGIPSAIGTGMARLALGATAAALLAIGLGLGVASLVGPPAGAGGREARQGPWSEAARIARDYPLVGAGLGAYPSIAPSYKDRDETTVAEQSTLGRWTAETGLAGLALLAAAVGWCVARLPGACRRIGTADRAIAAALLGAVACFAAVSARQWTIEIGAVALAASAVLGAFDRWLSGATDLFLDRA